MLSLKWKSIGLKQTLKAFFLVGMIFVVIPGINEAGIGDGLTDDEKKQLWMRLKKINLRLSELETNNLKSLQESQGIILLQIQELQKAIAQFQGTLELMTNELKQVSNQAQKDRNQMFEEWARLRDEVNKGMEGVRQGIAQDVENLAKQNLEFLNTIQSGNQSSLETIAKGIENQSNQLAKTQGILRDELIPAIAEQQQRNIQILTTRLDAFAKQQEGALAEFQQQVSNGLNQVEAKNQAIKQVLQKSISLQKDADENILKQANLINKTMAQQLPAVANNIKILDQKTGKINESVNSVNSSFNNLSQSITTLHSGFTRLIEIFKKRSEQEDTQTLALDAKVDDVGQKVLENRDNTGLANQKLNKLTDFLKTLATTQTQMDQSLRDQSGNKIERLFGEMETMTRNVAGIKAEQKAIKKALADLRRKANVNISRNDDIKKTQKELKSVVKKLVSQKK
tara:strand:+ start:145 stop:1509 length:1365 start_codon:yes stop_codon:yes gene_type:complete